DLHPGGRQPIRGADRGDPVPAARGGDSRRRDARRALRAAGVRVAVAQAQTGFATTGSDRVAYQVLGDGPIDLVHTIGLWSAVDVILEDLSTLRYLRRLASFCRVIWFDSRGSGLSDPRP